MFDMDKKEEEKSLVAKAVSAAIDKALDMVTSEKEIRSLVAEYQRKDGSYDVDGFISSQKLKAGAVGVATGIPGLPFLPATLPADVAGTTYFQIRMVSGIAYMRGYDLHSDRVKSMALICLLGGAASKMAKDIISHSLEYLIAKAAEKIAEKAVQQAASKAIPLIGGVIGGGLDYLLTDKIAEAAKEQFPQRESEEYDTVDAEAIEE